MSTYRPNSRSHLMLEQLSEASATFAELLWFLGHEGKAQERRSDSYAMDQMLMDGLVSHDAIYTITEAGEDVLHALRLGVEVEFSDTNGTPNARIFAAEDRAGASAPVRRELAA